MCQQAVSQITLPVLAAGALAAAQQDAVRKEAAHQKALDDMQVGSLLLVVSQPAALPLWRHDRSRVARWQCMASMC